MSGENVHLQFTQDDRDMIRDTSRDVKQILEKLDNHDAGFQGLADRVKKLEDWQTRVMAICTAAGIGIGFALKVILK